MNQDAKILVEIRSKFFKQFNNYRKNYGKMRKINKKKKINSKFAD